jgi:hypothetical protein
MVQDKFRPPKLVKPKPKTLVKLAVQNQIVRVRLLNQITKYSDQFQEFFLISCQH